MNLFKSPGAGVPSKITSLGLSAGAKGDDNDGIDSFRALENGQQYVTLVSQHEPHFKDQVDAQIAEPLRILHSECKLSYKSPQKGTKQSDNLKTTFILEQCSPQLNPHPNIKGELILKNGEEFAKIRSQFLTRTAEKQISNHKISTHKKDGAVRR